MISLRTWPSLALIIASSGCYDPTHLDAVKNLGPEAPGESPSPTHRAGQPCLTCHGGDGPADVTFAVAGTLYLTRGGREPLVGGKVTITDERGESRPATSNEVGNFFILEKDWVPAFPLTVKIEAQGIKREMVTSIGRNGGCGSCHREGGDRELMPGVFLKDK